ncbi:MAG TPA: HAD-IB family hydrolase [Acidimicrobiales bacterium]|nr:HAD-IB family hydrolase [Acidimicrobiales bacterium]
MDQPGGIAAFDFDGTLTRADTFLGFLRLVAGPRAVAGAMVAASPHIRLARRDPAWRDLAKAFLIRRLLGGLDADEVARAGRRYAPVAAGQVTAAMSRLVHWHRQAGHRLVVVSASLEVYLLPAAPLIGVDHVIATRLAVDGSGRLTGEIEGGNCRGPEKAVRLGAWMAAAGVDPDAVPMWAYGDSRGDDHMLALARTATRVRRGRPPAGVPG